MNPLAKLRPRHRPVALLVVQGKTARQIAAELGLSPTTARKYVQDCLRLLGLHNRVELAVLIAKGGGWNDEPQG